MFQKVSLQPCKALSTRGEVAHYAMLSHQAEKCTEDQYLKQEETVPNLMAEYKSK